MCRCSMIMVLPRPRPGASRDALAVIGHPWPSRLARPSMASLRAVHGAPTRKLNSPAKMGGAHYRLRHIARSSFLLSGRAMWLRSKWAKRHNVSKPTAHNAPYCANS